jgi:dTDP-4-amino-4,6-dideoxygalactose transaminase
VLTPAYGCPDIVSAIAFAGARAKLIDLDGNSPFPHSQAWLSGIDSNTLAVISVGFLGMRDPFGPEQAAAAGLPTGAFVEDCCQVHPMAVPRETDRSVVVSFGRGKPVSLLHGGAARLMPEIAGFGPRLSTPGDRFAEVARVRISAGLYNLLRSPWLYGWVTRLPGLNVGKTEFDPLDDIQPMNSRVRAFLDPAQGWREPRRHALQRRLRQALLDARPHSVAADLWQACGSDEDWLLRYPLLLRDRETRDDALARLNAAGLGASAMYGRALQDIPGARAHVAASAPCNGATEFADKLLTLPLHADVQERDVISMCEILTEVGRS